MSSGLEKIKRDKLEKLEKIKSKGINPYPSKSKRDTSLSFVRKNFQALFDEKKQITISGRIMAKREHGGSTFCVLDDGTERLQIYLKKNTLGEEKYNFFIELLEVGDFIDAKGTLFVTKKGEETLEVLDFAVLVKTLLPLPEKWHGLSDIEERYRKRYLDLLVNKEVKEKFQKRSQIIKAMREFLEENGFLEVETPILQTIPGGALAKPFKTHLNALNLDLYLRVAPELYLKRLLVGGFEKVYEIGRCFRNEGMDATHNPDFTMMECYASYQDYNDFMQMTENMIQHIVKKINNGSLKIKHTRNEREEEIDFSGPYPKIEFSELLKKHTGIDYDAVSEKELFDKAVELKIDIPKGANKGKIADEIYKELVRPNILQPIFMINHPIELSPLAKKMESDERKVERFQLVVAGVEVANAFSELNDPQDQLERFKAQQEDAKRGDDEAQRMDKDFIEALEYGMPPAAGLGVGIERLVMLLTNSHHVREVILFPTMRPKND